VVLQTEVSRGRFAEALPFGEFTLGDAFVPVLTAFDEFAIEDAVEFDLAFLGGDHDSQSVPLAGRFGRVGFSGIELIEPATFLGIATADVILDLDFGAGEVRRFVGLENVKHDATVGPFGDFEFEFEFKGIKFFAGDQVFAACFVTLLFSRDAGQRPVGDSPSGGDVVAVVFTPGIDGTAIEQVDPSGRVGGLVFGESCRVDGRETDDDREEEKKGQEAREREAAIHREIRIGCAGGTGKAGSVV